MLVQRRHQKCVIGERERDLHPGDFAVVSAILQRLDRPVIVGLRIAVEADALCRMITGVGIDQDERMRATFQGRARDEPRLEQRLLYAGLGATVDQMQARAAAVERRQESREQVLVARRGCLCNDDLTMPDPEVSELESI